MNSKTTLLYRGKTCVAAVEARVLDYEQTNRQSETDRQRERDTVLDWVALSKNLKYVLLSSFDVEVEARKRV